MIPDAGQWLVERARRADALLSQGSNAEARRVILDAIAVAPKVAALHAKLAMIEYALGEFDAAIEAAKRAVALGPDLVEARVNLGSLLERRGESAAAIEQFDAALLRRPAYPMALFNRAKAHADLHRFDAAVDDYQAAISLDPDFAEAHVNLGMIELVRGNFGRGWEEYAWTMRLPAVRDAYRFFSGRNLWDGSPFPGKQLLITREQGLGDFIQMVRFFPAVAALGGELHVECPPELMRLVAEIPATLHESDGLSITQGDFSRYLPVMQLPRVLGIGLETIPSRVPYIRADPHDVTAWQARLSASRRRKVGVVWAGHPQKPNDAVRSIPAAALEPLCALDGIAWFGLQKARRAHEAVPASLEMEQLGEELADFGVTAAIVDNLDLVIAVDTAVAHLAGAMNRPVWLLLPYHSDWRWLLERSDSPWYPSMRIFRQRTPGDWSGVFDRVVDALRTGLQPISC
jgi:Flp pilus assembly protein TadD